MDASDALAASALFSGCRRPLLKALAAVCGELVLEPDEALPLPRDGPLLVVLKGYLAVRVGRGPAVVARPGTVLNAVAMLGLMEEADAFRPSAVARLSPSSSCARRGPGGSKDRRPAKGPQSVNAAPRGPYEAFMPGIIPASAFADRQRTCGSVDFRRGLSVPDDMVSIFVLCPDAVSYHRATHSQQGGDASSSAADWPEVQVRALRPEEMRPRGKSPASLPAAGVVLATLSLSQVMDLSRKPDLEADALNDFQFFIASMLEITDVWRSLLSRCGRALPADPEILWAIAEVARRSRAEAGSLVVTEGDAGDGSEDLILIEEGLAVVEKAARSAAGGLAKAVAVGQLASGALIGELCLLTSNVPRAATVRAVTSVELLVLPKAGLLKVLARFPGALGAFDLRLREVSQALGMRLPVRHDSLESLQLFRGCDIAFITDLARESQRQTFIIGQIIREEGCEGTWLHVLEHGACVIEASSGTSVTEVHAGECFGDIVLLGMERGWLDATVRATTPLAVVLAIGEDLVQLALNRTWNSKEREHFSEAVDLPPLWRNLSRVVAQAETFKACRPDYLEVLSRAVELNCFMPGQTLFVQGQRGQGRLFFLRGGQLTTEVDGMRIGDLAQGAVLGEDALLGGGGRWKVTARALTFSFVLSVPRDAFILSLDAFPEDRAHFCTLASNSTEWTVNQWSFLADAPRNVLLRLNLFAERTCYCRGERSVEARGRVLLLLNGEVTVVNLSGAVAKVLSAGSSWNAGCLCDLETEESSGELSLLPRTDCEFRVISRETWDHVLQDFQSDLSCCRDLVLRSVASKTVRHMHGLDLGSPVCARWSALFKVAPDAFAAAISARMEPTLFSPGEKILTKGKEGDGLYALVDGEAEIHCSSWRVTCGSGKVFGEAELLGLSAAFNVEVAALTRCTILFLSRHSFAEVLDQHQASRGFFAASLADAKTQSCENLPEMVARLARSAPLHHNAFVDQLCVNAEHIFVEPGGTLMEFGERCSMAESPLFVTLSKGAVVEGLMRIVIGIIPPGTIIGEAGALGFSDHRSSTVRNGGPGLLHCLVVSGKALHEALLSMPEMADVFETLYKERLVRNKDFATRRFAWMHGTVCPALAKTALFKGCHFDLLFAIAASLVETEYKKGEHICVCGSPTDYVVLLQGCASVTARSGKRVGYIAEGASVGEAAALGLLKEATADVCATEACRVLRVPISAVLSALARPTTEDVRASFEFLQESRRRQVEQMMPLAAMPIGVPPDDVCARAVSMHAEHILLEAGELWEPLPYHDLGGPHIGVFLTGQARFEARLDGRSVAQVLEHSIFPEGLLYSCGARVRAVTKCQGYRIRKLDFDLAIGTYVKAPWLHQYRMLEKDSHEHLLSRLGSLRGVAEGLAENDIDAHVRAYGERRLRAVARAQRVRMLRGGLPGSAPGTPAAGAHRQARGSTPVTLRGGTIHLRARALSAAVLPAAKMRGAERRSPLSHAAVSSCAAFPAAHAPLAASRWSSSLSLCASAPALGGDSSVSSSTVRPATTGAAGRAACAAGARRLVLAASGARPALPALALAQGRA